jgi:hypothetical protein
MEKLDPNRGNPKLGDITHCMDNIHLDCNLNLGITRFTLMDDSIDYIFFNELLRVQLPNGILNFPKDSSMISTPYLWIS